MQARELIMNDSRNNRQNTLALTSEEEELENAEKH